MVDFFEGQGGVLVYRRIWLEAKKKGTTCAQKAQGKLLASDKLNLQRRNSRKDAVIKELF